jgi:hypothetical protein
METPKTTTTFTPGVPSKAYTLTGLSEDPNVLKIYTNGFQCSVTLADAGLLLKLNDVPMALVSMSLPAMKSLHSQLGLLLETYKRDIGEVQNFEELTEVVKAKRKQ